MENLKIKQFLDMTNNSDGDGSGSGYGNGDGSGNGYGSGYGSGIKSINGHIIYYIDRVPTVITNIHQNIAKGYILKYNVYLVPCYIVKGNGYFAHGNTITDAQTALEEKIIANFDVDERINCFLKQFRSGIKYPAKDFYKWHSLLTGSCELGRRAFAEEHDIDIETDEYTVEEFVNMTKNSFGGKVIRRVAEKANLQFKQEGNEKSGTDKIFLY